MIKIKIHKYKKKYKKIRIKKAPCIINISWHLGTLDLWWMRFFFSLYMGFVMIFPCIEAADARVSGNINKNSKRKLIFPAIAQLNILGVHRISRTLIWQIYGTCNLYLDPSWKILLFSNKYFSIIKKIM